MANVASANPSLPIRALGRFLSQRQASVNIAVMNTRGNFPQDSPHNILTFVVQALLNFLELKYQGKDISPFDTNPLTMWVSVGCLLAYWLAYVIELTGLTCILSPTKAHALRRIMVLLGSLSVGCLASMIFPDSVQLALFLFYTLLALCGLFHPELTLQCKWIKQMIVSKLFGASHPQGSHMRRTSTDALWLAQNTLTDGGNILPL